MWNHLRTSVEVTSIQDKTSNYFKGLYFHPLVHKKWKFCFHVGKNLWGFFHQTVGTRYHLGIPTDVDHMKDESFDQFCGLCFHFQDYKTEKYRFYI